MIARRILVVDGNTAATRALQIQALGYATGTGYANALRHIDESLTIDIVTPADGRAEFPAGLTLTAYDGVAVTGSALNVYQGGSAVERQIELVGEVFAAGIPLFGSCWGLQVAVAAAGGEISPNPHGREFGFGRRIAITAAGINHAMYAGKPPVFEAPTVHLDTIVSVPPGASILAENEHGIQALALVSRRVSFWGVQYHPEYDYADIAAAAERYRDILVREQFFEDLQSVASFASELRTLQTHPLERSLLWRYGLGSAVSDRRIRSIELCNWLRTI